MNRTVAVAATCAAVLALTPACARPAPAHVTFPAGTTMARLHDTGRIRVGVKFDQPGLGFRNPATNKFSGFDFEIARIVAAKLGLTPDRISYREARTMDRERLLRDGRVDIVIASYSITDEHRQKVDQAGPYYVTHQQLLVRRKDRDTAADPARIPGDRICSATGSTSIRQWQQRYGTQPVAKSTYTECVQRLLGGSIDAVTTDGAVLLGYAAQQPTKLAVVGIPFGTERYGIGYRKGDFAFCQFLTDTITRVRDDGSWKKAFNATLGKASAPAPVPPTPDPCQV
jgi:glutamate transport system substrate-binding protein